MKTSKVIIDHSSIEKEFQEHLDNKENNRIIFSAPFGTGKSTFLQEYFQKESANFIYLTLYPVNYSVAANEDVFELIKYDLLTELIGKYHDEIELTKEDFSILLSSQVFILQRMKYMPIVTSILSLSQKIGKPATDLFKALKETVTDFKKFKSEMELDEAKIIEEFLLKAEGQSGSIYEMDDISKLICGLIGRIRTKRNSDGNIPAAVLVIDDLDRLDPDHIFRLFNVFSAHYDSITERNKFGFEKVIFVCDIDNIRKMFHNKYGQDVDFSGYIDKFYSKKVFDFNNKRFIKEKLIELVEVLPSNNEFLAKKYKLQRQYHFYSLFEWIVFSLLDARELSLRSLIHRERIDFPSYSFRCSKSTRILKSANYGFLVLIHIIKDFFPSLDMLEVKLRRVSGLYDPGFKPQFDTLSDTDTETIEQALIDFALPFILPEEDILSNRQFDKEVRFSYHVAELNATFHCNFDRDDNSRILVPHCMKVTTGSKYDSAEAHVDPYELLLTTFIICRRKGFLK